MKCQPAELDKTINLERIRELERITFCTNVVSGTRFLVFRRRYEARQDTPTPLKMGKASVFYWGVLLSWSEPSIHFHFASHTKSVDSVHLCSNFITLESVFANCTQHPNGLSSVL
jgi:hypothetical protein